MVIDSDLIAYLEDLSCLIISDEEKPHLSADLEDILKSMGRLSELDTADIPERSHPFDDVNAFRDDETGESFDRELILRNAAYRDDEMFIAPKTIE